MLKQWKYQCAVASCSLNLPRDARHGNFERSIRTPAHSANMMLHQSPAASLQAVHQGIALRGAPVLVAGTSRRQVGCRACKLRLLPSEDISSGK